MPDMKPTWNALDKEMKIRLSAKQKRSYERAATSAKVELSAWVRATLDAAAEKGA